MTRNKLITFCYLFITGIGLAMRYTAGPDALGWLWAATLALAAITIGAFILVSQRARPAADAELSLYGGAPADRTQVTLWVLLLLTGMVFGYTRYIAFIQSPDTLLGTWTHTAQGQAWKERRAMSTTSFLKLKTQAAVTEDVRLRVVGKLEALQPIRDENNLPILNEDGRWAFSQYNLKQDSGEITIPAGTPANTEILIQKPFTSIERVEALNTPTAPVHLRILQPQNTVSLFARSGRVVVPVSVLGRINSDPWVYSFKTILSVQPEYIQYQPDGPYFKIARQNIRVTMDPATPGYEVLASSDAYGYDIALTGELVSAPHSSNKAGFDQANYLESYNIGGQIRLQVPRDAEAPAPIQVILPQDADRPRTGNGLVEFSLYLRDEIVRVIKQTTPQPNAAFHGALTLGLRYGMQNTVSMANDMYKNTPVPPPIPLGKHTDRLIADEFRYSGINHVLAVSGLHVTIITVMFMGIFAMVKVSKKVYVPFIIFALVIFAIITGARPSTLRAVIMNSLFLLTWGYMSESIRSSALLGVPIAAIIILLQNPAMAIDPSFTLSFGAILSLAILTQPFFDLFKRLKGNDFAVLVILLTVLTWAFARHWLFVTTLRFWVFYTVLGVVLFALSRMLTRMGFTPLRDYGLANLPPGIAGFIAAQFGIQIGMMVPLSPFYFFRWPVAGAYANLIAIPLVGVVLQLSMLAGLTGLIPGIGIYIALFLSAANWIFSIGFLLIGHYFSRWFIYPFMTKPTVYDLGVYFAAVAVFAYWRPLWFRVVRPFWRRASSSRRIIACGSLAVLLLGIGWGCQHEQAQMRPEGELEISVLSVGYASGIMVNTPDRRTILIDSGNFVTSPTTRIDAERTILPQIFAKQIRSLESLVITSPAAEHSGGIETVFTAMDAKHCDYPAAVAPVLAKEPLASILDERSPNRIKHRISGTTITPRMLTAGDIIYQTECDGKPFIMEALGPREGDTQTPLSVRIQFGDFVMLVTSDLTLAQQQEFLANTPPEKLKAQVVVAPHHGTAGLETVKIGLPDAMPQQLANITGKLLKATEAEAVVFEFGNPRPVEPLLYKVARKIHGLTRRAAEDALPTALNLATDTDGAIHIQSDGVGYRLTTQLSETGTEVDEPTLLEIGGW